MSMHVILRLIQNMIYSALRETNDKKVVTNHDKLLSDNLVLTKRFAKSNPSNIVVA